MPELFKFITLNRLNAVISKIGRPAANDMKRRNETVRLMMEDILEAFEESYPSILADFPISEVERLSEKTRVRIQQLLNEYFVG